MTIGRSVQGRAIVARLYGSPTASKVGVMIGSMHGSEPDGMRVTNRLRKIGAPADTAMWVIRTLNPDGAVRRTRGNARGVDLNRNSPHLWRPIPGSKVHYPGTGPESEPETKAYVKFLSDIKPDLVLIYHQAGNGIDSYQQKNKGLTKGLAKRMGLPVKSFNCSGECTGTLTGWFNNTFPGTALTVELPSKFSQKKTLRYAKAAQWSLRYVPDEK